MFMDVLRATPGSVSGCIDLAAGSKALGLIGSHRSWAPRRLRTHFSQTAKSRAEAAFLPPMRCPRERRPCAHQKPHLLTPTPENN